MKPVIYRRYDSWFCGSTKDSDDWGIGHTPIAAYQQWKQGGWFGTDLHLSKGSTT